MGTALGAATTSKMYTRPSLAEPQKQDHEKSKVALRNLFLDGRPLWLIEIAIPAAESI